MSRDISISRAAAGGHGLPETMSQELRQIIQDKWNGSLMKLAESLPEVGYYTVYSILVQGGGKGSLELIGTLADGLSCSKTAVAKALKKSSPEQRKKAILVLCKNANISITELSIRCWSHKSYIYQVINSNKRTQNFLKLVDAFGLDLERFEQHYKSTNFAA